MGTAANTIDVNNYTKYAAAGISEYYLRRFPQFSSVLLGNNDGRSEYNSLQVRLQRQFGALRVAANYTWSKSHGQRPFRRHRRRGQRFRGAARQLQRSARSRPLQFRHSAGVQP